MPAVADYEINIDNDRDSDTDSDSDCDSGDGGDSGGDTPSAERRDLEKVGCSELVLYD